MRWTFAQSVPVHVTCMYWRVSGTGMSAGSPCVSAALPLDGHWMSIVCSAEVMVRLHQLGLDISTATAKVLIVGRDADTEAAHASWSQGGNAAILPIHGLPDPCAKHTNLHSLEVVTFSKGYWPVHAAMTGVCSCMAIMSA